MRGRWLYICVVVWFAVLTAALLSSDSRTAKLAANTLMLSAAVVGLSVPVGAALAFLLVRTDLPGRRAVICLLAGFLFLPLYVQAGAWKAAFDLEGWFTGLRGGPALLVGWQGAIWVHAVAAVPWVVLIVGAGLATVERELEEQALLDGSPLWVAWHVTFRRAAGAVGIAALWVALITAGEMSVTDFFQIRTFAEELYTAYAVGDIQPLPSSSVESSSTTMGAASFIGGMAIGLALLVAVLLLLVRLNPTTRRSGVGRALMFELGPWRWAAVAGIFIIVSLLIFLPLASLAWKAGVEVVESPQGRLRTWSANKCLDMVMLNPRIDDGQLIVRHQKELKRSFDIDIRAATICVLIGLTVAWCARRGHWRASSGLFSVCWLLAIPGPLVGLAIIGLLNRPEIPGLVRLYDRTIAAPLLACVVRSLPLATLVLWTSLRTLPDDVLEAARLDGARLWRIWLDIVVPMRWRSIIVAWLVAFVWSLGELDASVLVSPPGPQPLSIRVFGLLHFGAEDQVAGLCLAIYFTVQAVALACWLLMRRATR